MQYTQQQRLAPEVPDESALYSPIHYGQFAMRMSYGARWLTSVARLLNLLPLVHGGIVFSTVCLLARALQALSYPICRAACLRVCVCGTVWQL